MNRYLTILDTSNGNYDVEVFTEKDDYKSAVNRADEWVWQYAINAETAKIQHFVKHDKWKADPTKETY